MNRKAWSGWTAGLLLVAGYAATIARQSPGGSPSELVKDAAVRARRDAVRATEPQTLDDQFRVCERPAPPFHEAARGELLRQAFQQLGLRGVRVDTLGNVIGERTGTAGRPHVVLSAH